MANHVKLEVAIQIAAENVANYLLAMRNAENEEAYNYYNFKLQEAYVDKELVAIGHIETIEKLLNERKGDSNE